MKQSTAPTIVEHVVMWDIERTLPNPLNPRGDLEPDSLLELVASIREKGILTPLLATPHEDIVHIVAGHRRRAAALMAGLKQLPLIIHKFTEREQLEIMLIENLQRADLTPLQEARAYERALASGGRKSDLARRIGIPVQRVHDRLDLLKLDPAVQQMIEREDLRLALVPALLLLKDPREQKKAAVFALQRMLTVDQIESYIHGRLITLGHRTSATNVQPKARGKVMRDKINASAEPDAITRTEAEEMLSGEGATNFEMLRRALANSCDPCDVKSYPEICRACPLPQFIAALMREMAHE